MKKSLLGSELIIGQHRRVQGASYSFWVDIYVEIDFALCEKHGEACTTEVEPKTLFYGELYCNMGSITVSAVTLQPPTS